MRGLRKSVKSSSLLAEEEKSRKDTVKTIIGGCIGILGLVLAGAIGNQEPATQNWTHFVRIGGHSLSLDHVDEIIKSATKTHVFGIETDNDIPGRYESFLDPAEKL